MPISAVSAEKENMWIKETGRRDAAYFIWSDDQTLNSRVTGGQIHT